MTEFVQRRVEEFVPIFHEIKRLELLSPTEIKNLNTGIQEHEHAIQKGTRTLDDVLRYVEYQMDLLKTIERQRNVLQITEKKVEIDEKIKGRINSLFGCYQRNFYNNLEYWRAKINFTSSQKWHQKTSAVYLEAAKLLGQQHPILWRDASYFEWTLSKLKNIDSARKILQMGIRGDRVNVDLYLWAFELELKHSVFLQQKIDKLKESGRESTDVDVYMENINKCMKATDVLFTEAKTNCWASGCTVKLYVKFYSVLTKYGFTKLGEDLLRDLQANCSSDEETYNVLALLKFNNNQIERGFHILEKGIEVTGTMKMYDIAVNCLKLIVTNQPSMKVLKMLHSLFIDGEKNDKLSASCYENWIKFFYIFQEFKESKKIFRQIKEPTTFKRQKVSTSEEVAGDDEETSDCDDSQDFFNMDDIEKVIEAGLRKYPDNSNIIITKSISKIRTKSWKPSAMSFTIRRMKETDKVDDQLMEFFLLHSIQQNSKSSQQVIKNLVLQYPENQRYFILYLQYVLMHDGIEATRKAYQELQLQSSYEIMKFMAHLEYIHMEQHPSKTCDKLLHIRTIMESACLKYGQKSVDVWLDYKSYEERLGNFEKASEISARAMKTLPPHLSEKFILPNSNGHNKEKNIISTPKKRKM